MQINMEEGSKRVQERDAWAQGVFPAAHERLRKAAAVLPAGTAAQPFVDALSERAAKPACAVSTASGYA